MKRRYEAIAPRPTRPRARLGRRAGRVWVAVLVAAIAAGVQLTSAAPADAVPVVRAEKISGLRSMDSPKSATVACPAATPVLVGGGGEVEGGGADPSTQPRLTGTLPIGDRFLVVAETPFHDSASPWAVRAYAICAPTNSLDEYQPVFGLSENDSRVFKRAETERCPGDTVAYSAGGFVSYPSFPGPPPGRVGLQLVRTSQPLDIGRATAREYGFGYLGSAQVTAWAICARREGGIHAEGTLGLGEKATHRCSSGRVHGAGGGGGLSDGGDAFLQYVIPSEDLRQVFVRLTQPLNPAIGGMVASATCAT
jgi:hypothetical protein